mmetsp:Transcript_15456/g.52409  ORF Transcript_15456/g.52409 Transcript_15456/m.52409 type:complete len:364 (+) Transcript_15456:273-1364(+)
MALKGGGEAAPPAPAPMSAAEAEQNARFLKEVAEEIVDSSVYATLSDLGEVEVEIMGDFRRRVRDRHTSIRDERERLRLLISDRFGQELDAVVTAMDVAHGQRVLPAVGPEACAAMERIMSVFRGHMRLVLGSVQRGLTLISDAIAQAHRRIDCFDRHVAAQESAVIDVLYELCFERLPELVSDVEPTAVRVLYGTLFDKTRAILHQCVHRVGKRLEATEQAPTTLDEHLNALDEIMRPVLHRTSAMLRHALERLLLHTSSPNIREVCLKPFTLQARVQLEAEVGRRMRDYVDIGVLAEHVLLDRVEAGAASAVEANCATALQTLGDGDNVFVNERGSSSSMLQRELSFDLSANKNSPLPLVV